MMCAFFMMGNSFYVFWCADSIFCEDGRFRNPDVKNSYRVWFVPCLVVLYPLSTIQYPVPRLLSTTVPLYYSTTTLPSCCCFLVVIITTAPSFVALCCSLLLFPAPLCCNCCRSSHLFYLLKQDRSTAKTKTACKRSWHQSPARILRLVVVCLHVVPYWRRSLTCLGWLSDWKRQTVLSN